MEVKRPKNDIVEIFVYASNDTTLECRSLWNIGVLRKAASDAFGNVPFYTYSEYLEHRSEDNTCVVALGMHSGHEIKPGQSCSMD